MRRYNPGMPGKLRAGIGLASRLTLLVGLGAGVTFAPAVSSGAEPAAGQFLVASRELLDPNFYQTVVLLLEHGDGGALGLVVNRRTNMTAADALPTIDALREHDQPIYMGGPVSIDSLLMLVRAAEPPEGAEHVFANVHVSASSALLGRLVEGNSGAAEFRVYAGYAGWAPGQLDFELARGGWHLVPASEELVFAEQPGRIWGRLVPPEQPLEARLYEPPESFMQ